MIYLPLLHSLVLWHYCLWQLM